jgi:type II secretory pathway pseudopilin PulG
MKRTTAAYTLIEVLVAAAILMIAVGAAGALALATVTQEETNARIVRCLNLHEQAVRLYQLGLDPSVVSAVLPVDPAVVSLVFTTHNLPISDLGTVEQADSTLTFTTSPLAADWTAQTWSSGPSSDSARRTSQITAIRPSLR